MNILYSNNQLIIAAPFTKNQLISKGTVQIFAELVLVWFENS